MLVVSICSAKGGVGKSFTTSLLAKNLSSLGLNIGILDADVYGPSQHTNLGIKLEPLEVIDQYFIPRIKNNIKFISASMMAAESDINLIRGPLVSSILQELYKKSKWDDTDVLLIDMPPGTGDSYISLFQSGWIDVALIITSSSQLSLNQSIKTHELCKKFHIPVAGTIENFHGFTFPDSINLKNFLSENLKNQMKILFTIPLVENLEYEIPDIHFIFQSLKKYSTKINTKNIL